MKSCRCLFCDDKTTDDKRKKFIASNRKSGKDGMYWSICGECIPVCVDILINEGIE